MAPEQVVATGFRLHGVCLDRIDHEFEVLLQFDETLHEARGILEMHVVVHEAMGNEERVFQAFGIIDGAGASIGVGILVR